MRAFSYTMRQAFSQIGRNKNMSTASVFAITAMMLILGVFFAIMVNVNMLAQYAQDQFDTIQVYLLDEVSASEGVAMAEEMQKLDYVESVKYISKEDAFDIMRDRWGENAHLLDGVVNNPFPATIEITSTDLKYEKMISQQLEEFDGIERVNYNQEVIEKILKITGYIGRGALVLILVLIVVSIIVVSNTIKLTVHAREKEIQIMKYVGATNWFVRGPFLVEGIIIGLIASVLSVAIVGAAYYKFADVFTQKILLLLNSGVVPFGFLMQNLVIIFVALGVCIGSLGSILSMRRFLRA